MKTAIIITTYNRPDALSAVLRGYLAQTDLNFELIVADDGSTPETKVVIDGFAMRAPFDIKHVWHKDNGFRAAAIRNRAIASTQAEYIVFTDGDCIPLPQFVTNHKLLAEIGCFLSSNRILLSKNFTSTALNLNLDLHKWGWIRWVGARFQGHINRLLPLINTPQLFNSLRRLQPNRWQGAKTCNLGVWRSDLIKVNGLDEYYSGWGMEDSDLVIRLLHLGVHSKSGRFATPVLHLWHQENDRSSLKSNISRLGQLLKSNTTQATIGLDQYT